MFNFDIGSPRGDEALLLGDLETLITLGLLEAQPSPDGPLIALTDLGRDTPEFEP